MHTPSDRIASLDLLRLVAALAVVAFHYLYRAAAGQPAFAPAFPETAGAAIYGYLGVNLFFLISGYVIAFSAEGRDWRSFAAARFARLVPGFVLCMSATAIALGLAGDPRLPVSAAQWAANLTFLPQALGHGFIDGVYWSIVLELVFYFWVALAVASGLFARARLGLVAAWLALSLLNEHLLGSGALRLAFVTEFAPLFATGVLLHHIRAHGRSPEAMVLLVAAFVLGTVNMTVTRDWMLAHYGEAAPLAGLVLANLVIHALFVVALALGGRLRASRATLLAGGVTYPLYLLHQNLGYLALEGASPVFGRWLALAAVTAAMLLASWAVWRFIETPLRRPVQRLAAALLERIGVPSRMVRA